MKVTLDTPIDGYEINAEYRVPKEGEYYVDNDGSIDIAPSDYTTPWLVLAPVKPKHQKYILAFGLSRAHEKGVPKAEWVYVDGLCPFHDEASIVRVKFKNGAESRCMSATEVDWTNVVSCVFVECAEGYEL